MVNVNALHSLSRKLGVDHDSLLSGTQPIMYMELFEGYTIKTQIVKADEGGLTGFATFSEGNGPVFCSVLLKSKKALINKKKCCKFISVPHVPPFLLYLSLRYRVYCAVEKLKDGTVCISGIKEFLRFDYIKKELVFLDYKGVTKTCDLILDIEAPEQNIEIARRGFIDFKLDGVKHLELV